MQMKAMIHPLSDVQSKNIGKNTSILAVLRGFAKGTNWFKFAISALIAS